MSIITTTLEEMDTLYREKRSVVSKGALLDLIDEGCRDFYREDFGARFVDVWDSKETSDTHHTEAIEFHWNSRLALIACEQKITVLEREYHARRITEATFTFEKEKIQEEFYPEYWAYFAIWSRGHLKTTIARRMVITDAMLSYAYNVGGYALVVGGTKNKARGSAASIDTLLQLPAVKQYAEPLTRVKETEKGHAKGWTAAFINTAANYVFHFIGLDEGVAGTNLDDIRPTFIIPDDVDDREDSPVISDNRYNVLTRAIIPTQQWNTLFFYAQNLISRFSVLYRIWTQQARVLTNRYFTDPIPAVRGLVTRQETVNGIVKDVVVAGESTWRGWDRREIQKQIDSMTLTVFNLECQHEVEQSKEGVIMYNYDDMVHPVSYSQFEAKFGNRGAWKEWFKVLFNDYARTKTRFHANVAGYMAVSSHNTALPGHTFLIPMSFKANTPPEDMAVRFLDELEPYAYETEKGKPVTWSELVADAWKRLKPDQHFDDVFERLEYLATYYARIIPRYSRPVLERHLVKHAVISHSEDKLRKSLNTGFGFGFKPSNPTKNAAIEDINTDMRVDMHEPHCFDPDKQGYTRFHVLCPDDTTVPAAEIDGVKVYPPVPYPLAIDADNLHDSDLFRFQMRNCRYRTPKITERGEQIDEPEKLNDDFKQGLQMVYFKGTLQNIRLTMDEKVGMLIPEPVKAAMREKVKADPVSTRLTYEFHEQVAKRALFPKEEVLEDWD